MLVDVLLMLDFSLLNEINTVNLRLIQTVKIRMSTFINSDFMKRGVVRNADVPGLGFYEKSRTKKYFSIVPIGSIGLSENKL